MTRTDRNMYFNRHLRQLHILFQMDHVACRCERNFEVYGYHSVTWSHFIKMAFWNPVSDLQSVLHFETTSYFQILFEESISSFEMLLLHTKSTNRLAAEKSLISNFLQCWFCEMLFVYGIYISTQSSYFKIKVFKNVRESKRVKSKHVGLCVLVHFAEIMVHFAQYCVGTVTL
jgi:hypothetical protein